MKEMVKYFLGVVFILSACTPIEPSAQAAPMMFLPSSTVQPSATISPTVTPTPTIDAYTIAQVTLVFAHATDTQVSIAKTEQAIANAQETQAAEAKIAAGIQTDQAAQTQTNQTAVATQTQGAQTQSAALTHIAQTATAKVEGTKMIATQMSIWFGALAVMVVIGLLVTWLGVKVWESYKSAKAKHLQDSLVRRDDRGNFPAIPADALNKQEFIVPDLAHRAFVSLGNDDLTTEQAMMNTHDRRELEGVRAIAEGRTRARPAAGNGPATGMPASAAAPSGLLTDSRLPMPEWTVLDNWDGKMIPYGMGARGLLTMDPSQFPHTGVFGQTRSGKSRYFLRTFIAATLAAGHRAVIIGKQGDFWPFENHPNAKLIAIRNVTEEGEALRYAGYLRKFVDEMNSRDAYLTAHHVSTWERAGREITFLFLDELGNNMQFMPRDVSIETFRWLGGLANEGGKNGLNLVISSQRSVGFRALVSQMGRAVFHVDRAQESYNIIGMQGAETLEPRHFLSLYGNVNHCVAFDPTDEQLMTFLAGRPAQALEPMNWIDGEVRDVTKDNLVRAESGPTDQQIAEHLLSGMSQSETERRLFGYAGGKAHSRVKAVYEALQTPTTTANMGATGPVAA